MGRYRNFGTCRGLYKEAGLVGRFLWCCNLALGLRILGSKIIRSNVLVYRFVNQVLGLKLLGSNILEQLLLKLLGSSVLEVVLGLRILGGGLLV